MDQLKEEEEDRHKETESEEEEEDRHKEAESEEEGGPSEESMDRHAEEEENSGGLEDEQKAAAAEAEEMRISSGESEEEAAVAARSLFAHACSVLQRVVQACACRLGLLHHSDPKPKLPAAIAATADSSPAARELAGDAAEEDTETAAEVITRVRAVKIKPPAPPREGGGGNGGEHQ